MTVKVYSPLYHSATAAALHVCVRESVCRCVHSWSHTITLERTLTLERKFTHAYTQTMVRLQNHWHTVATFFRVEFFVLHDLSLVRFFPHLYHHAGHMCVFVCAPAHECWCFLRPFLLLVLERFVVSIACACVGMLPHRQKKTKENQQMNERREIEREWERSWFPFVIFSPSSVLIDLERSVNNDYFYQFTYVALRAFVYVLWATCMISAVALMPVCRMVCCGVVLGSICVCVDAAAAVLIHHFTVRCECVSSAISTERA